MSLYNVSLKLSLSFIDHQTMTFSDLEVPSFYMKSNYEVRLSTVVEFRYHHYTWITLAEFSLFKDCLCLDMWMPGYSQLDQTYADQE